MYRRKNFLAFLYPQILFFIIIKMKIDFLNILLWITNEWSERVCRLGEKLGKVWDDARDPLSWLIGHKDMRNFCLF